MSQDVVNPAWFKVAIERQLKDQWITKWNNNLQNKGICSNYKIYKSVFCMEDYLLKLERDERIIL